MTSDVSISYLSRVSIFPKVSARVRLDVIIAAYNKAGPGESQLLTQEFEPPAVVGSHNLVAPCAPKILAPGAWLAWTSYSPCQKGGSSAGGRSIVFSVLRPTLL